MKGHFPFSHLRSFSRAAHFAAALIGATLCALLLALCIPCPSYAQDTGYISGTVIDKSGAAVAGADATLTSTGGTLTRTTTTNNDGAYVIAGLPGGTYNLSVTAKGFQDTQRKTLSWT